MLDIIHVTKIQWEAKINLFKIRRAKEWLSKKVTCICEVPALNRLLDSGFLMFTEESFRKLATELNEHQIPRHIKQTTITVDSTYSQLS